MGDFEIRDEPARRTAVVRGTVAMAEVPAFISEALPAVFEAAGRAGFAPGGPPFARYFSMNGDHVELEAGVALAAVPGAPDRAFGGTGKVEPGELPGGQVAVAWHVGPYETVVDTYERLRAWIAEQGREPAAVMWELYWTDPAAEPDPAKWRTEIVWPLL